MHFIFLSPCLSPHCLSISSFFLHRPIADLHEPSRHRLIAVELTHFSLSSLFSSIWLVFRLCVSGCTCVSGLSALCFGLFSALCFGLCLGCAGFLFWAWVSVLVCWFFGLLFLLFLTSFDGHGGVVFVQWFLWVLWWLWLYVGGWMKYYFIVVFILFYYIKS